MRKIIYVFDQTAKNIKLLLSICDRDNISFGQRRSDDFREKVLILLGQAGCLAWRQEELAKFLVAYLDGMASL